MSTHSKEKMIAANLLQWYDQNRRTLPWRDIKDPYKVWVSEIMLQQTRVDTVIPYFEKFMNRFPDVGKLAQAEEEEVLSYWQGLGYYSRARNLHQGVKEVAEEYAGDVPKDFTSLRSLPGIGDYTAGAILSMAYNIRCPAVDGNVIRVFSRLYAYSGNTANNKGKKEITTLVSTVLSETDRPGDFNQALMDLGSSLCSPTTPNCSTCPLRENCLAFQQQEVEQYPVKVQKKAVKNVTVCVGILKQQDHFLVIQRPAKGLLAGLWQFPSLEFPHEAQIPLNQDDHLQALFQSWGYETVVQEQELQVQHIFSHKKWFMTVRIYSVCQDNVELTLPVPQSQWIHKEHSAPILWAGPYRKIAQWLGIM